MSLLCGVAKAYYFRTALPAAIVKGQLQLMDEVVCSSLRHASWFNGVLNTQAACVLSIGLGSLHKKFTGCLLNRCPARTKLKPCQVPTVNFAFGHVRSGWHAKDSRTEAMEVPATLAAYMPNICHAQWCLNRPS